MEEIMTGELKKLHPFNEVFTLDILQLT